MSTVIEELRTFITDNFMLGQPCARLADDTSFLDNGVIDSTGLLELIGFIERTWQIKLADEELIPDNLDSLEKISRFLARRLAVPCEASAFAPASAEVG